ncbi:retrotransposable element tf2 protein type 2 [Lasius niger]|uniref:Retrotransposable element tf2 protein type 2 n=1 Tax=Lasius niger TaxID=67767 RepID=A0A0J7KYH3_LASNI|nr:retrotransposable element tf2 protein type 2 [Lasius niger]
MPHVDALSRQGYINFLPLERELEFRQLQDSKLKQIASELKYKDNEEFKLLDGLIYRKGNDRLRFVVPESMVNAIIKVLAL